MREVNKAYTDESALPPTYRSCLPQTSRIGKNAGIDTKASKDWAKVKKDARAFRERTIREAAERMAREREEKQGWKAGWVWA